MTWPHSTSLLLGLSGNRTACHCTSPVISLCIHKTEVGEAHRKARIVYGCNIDFIQLLGKGNYVLNYKDVSVSCQQQELYGPGG